MAALTLIEASKLHTNEVSSIIIEMFAMSNTIMRTLPFMNIPGNAYAYNLEGALPGVAFRGVNESFSTSHGIVNPQSEPLRISGGDIDVDNFIVETQGDGARTRNENMQIKAQTQDFQRAFFKGDSESNPREFDGLQKRLTGDQVISNKRAASPAGGEVLSLSKLDEAIDAVANPTHIFMNKALKRRMSQAARTSSVAGNITFEMNDFGEQVTLYNGIPVMAIEDAEGKDTVLTFTEAASDAGGSDVNTSVYVVSLMEGKLVGIQNAKGLDVRDLGEIDEKPVLRTRVEWYISIAMLHGRAASRLQDIIDGAIVA